MSKPTDDEVAACVESVRCPDCDCTIETRIDGDHVIVRVAHEDADCPTYQHIVETQRSACDN